MGKKLDQENKKTVLTKHYGSFTTAGKRKKNKENKEHCNDNLEKAAARS